MKIMDRTSVLLGDGHRMLVDCLVPLLEQNFRILGVAFDGPTLIEMAMQRQPEVIVMEATLPLINGIDATRILQKEHCRSKILIMAIDSDPFVLKEAFRAGASGFVLKECGIEELWMAIQSVAKGKAYITPLLADGIVSSLFSRRKAETFHETTMTVYQRTILQFFAEGKTVKETATVMGISVRTAEYHKRKIMQYFGAHTVSDLIRYAVHVKFV